MKPTANGPFALTETSAGLSKLLMMLSLPGGLDIHMLPSSPQSRK